jgi:hypothetical protein
MRCVALVPLVPPDGVDHPVLPRRRVTDRCLDGRAVRHPDDVGVLARRLVCDLVEHVGEVVHGVDDLVYVGHLERLDAGVDRQHLVVDDRGDPDAVHVVRRMERVAGDVVGRAVRWRLNPSNSDPVR